MNSSTRASGSPAPRVDLDLPNVLGHRDVPRESADGCARDPRVGCARHLIDPQASWFDPRPGHQLSSASDADGDVSVNSAGLLREAGLDAPARSFTIVCTILPIASVTPGGRRAPEP